VINETLRIHTTAGVGLPRLVPQRVDNPAHASPDGGVTILGYSFPPGTSLSVPTYTMHHSTAIWGSDAEDFKPARFAEGTLTEQQKAAFIPFSYGPRACLGRYIAEMELLLFAGLVFWRYEVVLDQGVDEWVVKEGFLRKPMALKVGVRKRRERTREV
jgi:benzoate 4-monooxygenase